MSFVSNLVGFTKKSDLPKLGKSFTYNMYVEAKDATEHAFASVLRPMPGYMAVSTMTGPEQGLFKVSRGNDGKPKMYGIWGKKLYLFEGDTPRFIGDIAGGAKCTFAETSGYGQTHPHLCICDGVQVYAVDTTLTYLEQQADFRTILMPYAYPNQAPTRVTPSWICYMYGYLIMGQENSDIFYTSYQYPFESMVDGQVDYDIFMGKSTADRGGYGNWTMSEWQPDNTVIGCSNGSRLYTLGERSFQVFTYSSSLTQPFTSPDTASKNIGIKNRESLAMFGDSIFWLGSSDAGDNVIYAMGADGSPTRISTDEIEAIIEHFNKDNLKAFCYRWKSHTFYVISFPDNDTTLAYDTTTNGWINLGSRKSSGKEGCFRYCNAAMAPNGEIWLQCYGKCVKAVEPYRNGSTWVGNWFEHDNTPILRKRAGGILSSDHKPMKIGSIKLITNNGDYQLITNRAPLITMRYSRDGATWESCGTYPLGRVGNYDYDTVFRPHTKCEYLTLEVGTSENIGFALYGMDVKGITCAKK